MKMDYRVRFDYIAQEEDELTIKKGEIIKNATRKQDGWYEGTLRGKTGLFPEMFVKLLDSEVVLRNNPSRARRVKAIFSYAAKEDDELTMEVGDVVEVIEEVEDGWFRGKLNGKVGDFPSNYVEDVVEAKPDRIVDNCINRQKNVPKTDPKYFKEQARLESFSEPPGWPISFIRPEDCARAGFFFLLEDDRVQCAFCRGVAGEWEQGDIPMVEHLRHFPLCPFILGLSVGNIPLGQENEPVLIVKEEVDGIDVSVLSLAPQPKELVTMSSSTESYISQALQTNHYKEINKTKNDILDAIRMYKGLKPTPAQYTFNNGTRKTLVSLLGTIPTWFKGSSYNIPIVILLLDTHPMNAPLVFVKPTPDMRIKTSRHVDQNGRVYLPYLHDWTSANSGLLELIKVLIYKFSEQPPVYAVPPGTPPQPPAGISTTYPVATPYPGMPSRMPMPQKANQEELKKGSESGNKTQRKNLNVPFISKKITIASATGTSTREKNGTEMSGNPIREENSNVAIDPIDLARLQQAQKNKIKKNLTTLIAMTELNPIVIAIFEENDILGDGDIATLNTERNEQEKIRRFYKIIQTRIGYYEVLEEAMIRTKQTGVAALLKM